MKHLLTAMLLFLGILYAHSQQIKLDPTFGNNGVSFIAATEKANTLNETAKDIIELPDGKLLALVAAGLNSYLVRHLPDGTIDSSYGTMGLSAPVNFQEGYMKQSSDGSIVVAGVRFDQASGIKVETNAYLIIASFNQDGGLNTAFGNGGTLQVAAGSDEARIRGITVAPDGDISLVAKIRRTDNSYYGLVMQLNADGSWNDDFGTNGKTVIDYPAFLAISEPALNGNNILLAIAHGPTQPGKVAIVALNGEGKPDLKFGNQGYVQTSMLSDDAAVQLLIQPDGRILLAGAGRSAPDFKQFVALFRFEQNGLPDFSFNNIGSTTLTVNPANQYFLKSMLLGADGSIYLAGSTNNPDSDLFIGKFSSDGQPDKTYGSLGVAIVGKRGPMETAEAFVLRPDGRCLAAGYVWDRSDPNFLIHDYLLMQVKPTGYPDTEFGSGGTQTLFFPALVSSLISQKVLSDGGVMLRQYSNTSNVARGIIHLDKKGILDKAFGNNGLVSDPSYLYEVTEDQKVVTFQTISIANTSIILMSRYTPGGQPDLMFGDKGQKMLKLQSNATLVIHRLLADGKWQILYFTINQFGQQQFFLSRLDENGDLDFSFGKDGQVSFDYTQREVPNSFSIQPDGKAIVTGNYQFIGPNPYSLFFKRYKTDGTLDETFGSNGILIDKVEKNNFSGLSRVQLNGKILVNAMTSNNFQRYRTVLLRYNSDGTRDSSFGKDGVVYDLPLPPVDLADGKMLAVLKNFETQFVRFNADGSLDESFGTGGYQLIDFGYPGRYSLGDVVQAGNRFLVNGSRLTGLDQIGFVAAFDMLETEKVQLTCPTNKAVATGMGICSATVEGIDPVITPAGSNAEVKYTLTGATQATGSGSASGLSFNKGTTIVTYSLVNDPSQQCTFEVVVKDGQAPIITGLKPSVSSIANANHKMQDVFLTYSVADNCGAANITISVSSNEAQNGLGDGDTAPDWEIVNDRHIRLRAERSTKGNGRTYTITITATDEAGNQSTATTSVTVLKNGVVNNTWQEQIDHALKTLALKLSVLNNPAAGDFTVIITSTGSNAPVSIKLSDANGRILKSFKTNSWSTLKLGSELKPGLYLLHAVQGGNTYTLKLIKK